MRRGTNKVPQYLAGFARKQNGPVSSRKSLGVIFKNESRVSSVRRLRCLGTLPVSNRLEFSWLVEQQGAVEYGRQSSRSTATIGAVGLVGSAVAQHRSRTRPREIAFISICFLSTLEDPSITRSTMTVKRICETMQLMFRQIGVIAETPDYENLSISAVLHYCKNKILRPYLRLLAVMGLRPTSSDHSENFSRHCFANFHTLQVTIFMCIGYVLQYMACFRRDRGFYYKLLPVEYEYGATLNVTRTLVYEKICYGNAVFSYLIPSTLHLIAYLYTVYLLRFKENEQLQNLMERAFLLSSNPVNRGNQKKLVRVLWLFIGMSVVWMTVALISVNVMMAKGTILFQWLEHSPSNVKLTAKVLLIICTLWHDMVQGTIITSYCLQGQLLMSHLTFLRAKLLQHTMPALDWMKEISEFKKLLKYFNDDLGPAVCIYTVVNLSWAAAGTAWLLKYDSVDVKTNCVTYISVINVILWILVSMAPFIQAARLTTACSMIQSLGHEVRTRPFVYQGTSGEDLDTILLYTSSLKMCARLFRVPITGRYLCLLLTVGSIFVLTLGQCHFFA